MSFANEHLSFRKFEDMANNTKQVAHYSDIMLSAIIGIIRFLIFGFMAYAFWIGAVFV